MHLFICMYVCMIAGMYVCMESCSHMRMLQCMSLRGRDVCFQTGSFEICRFSGVEIWVTLPVFCMTCSSKN